MLQHANLIGFFVLAASAVIFHVRFADNFCTINIFIYTNTPRAAIHIAHIIRIVDQ